MNLRTTHFFWKITLSGFTSVFFVAFMLVLLGSCQKKTASPDSKSQEPVIEDAALLLSLNDGEKWQVDDHTRQSIKRLTILVEQTPPEELGQAMAGEINLLFKGCTMTGPAHDQLHLILAEMLGRVNGLYSSDTAEERKVEISAIKNLLDKYGAHFE